MENRRENFEEIETSDFEGDENLEIETIAERIEAGIETIESENLESDAESEDINFLVGNREEYDEMMKIFEKGSENEENKNMETENDEESTENLENEAENEEEEFRKLESRKVFRPPFRR